MKKEHIKSVILVVLVISNLALSSRIWSNKKLWPSGYNFFVNVKNSFIVKTFSGLFNYNNRNYDSKAHINTPMQIIINTGYQTTRFALNQTHEIFTEANELAHQILSDALTLSEKSVSAVTQDEWYSVLMSKSIYLNYNIEYNYQLFASFFEINQSELYTVTKYITDIVIAADSSTSNISVYVKNGRDNSYFKINTAISAESLNELIELFQQRFGSADTSSANIINYSFDLFFDKGNQKVILSPMIPIFSNPQTYNVIKSENPVIKDDGTPNTFVINRLLNLFDINSETMRRYTEADGTIVFVENDAILKLSADGVIDFTANSPDTGIKLTDDAFSSEYDMICTAADFMDTVNNQISANRNLYIASDLTDEYIQPTVSQLYFDYVINGFPVSMRNINSGHAVCMTVSNGRIQKYTQVLRSYSDTGETSQTTSLIQSLDDMLKNYENTTEQITADKIYTAYIDDGSIGSKNADWNIILDN